MGLTPFPSQQATIARSPFLPTAFCLLPSAFCFLTRDHPEIAIKSNFWYK
jgi:hypothetical protein